MKERNRKRIKEDVRSDIHYNYNQNINKPQERKLTPYELKNISKFEKEEIKILKTHPKLSEKHSNLFFNKNKENVKNKEILLKKLNQPKNIKTPLLKYQLEGVNWMKIQESSIYKGGILADEMGLGKTLQIISLLSEDLDLFDKKSINLVICPVVSMAQWINEFEKHSFDNVFNIYWYYGSNINKKNDKNSFIEKNDKINVIITSYGKIESHFRRKNQSNIFDRKFNRIVLDEAHTIKSIHSSTSRALSNIDSEIKWLLTGTPVQNRLSDLYSLSKFLLLYPHSYYFCKKCPCESPYWLNRKPKYLLNNKNLESNNNENDKNNVKEVRRGFCTCGHFSAQHFSWFNRHVQTQIKQYGHTEKGVDVFEKLENITKKLVLRRTKQNLVKELGLPTKQVRIKRLYFSVKEKEFYESLYKKVREDFKEITNLNEKELQNISYQSYKKNPYGGVASNYVSIFSLLQRMRMAVNHPFLVTKSYKTETVICGFCGEESDDPVFSDCKHAFCREEAKLFLQKEIKCPVCKVKLSLNLQENSSENFLEKKQTFSINPSKWVSSTKIEFLVEELTNLKKESFSPKVLIFSQFVNFLEILRWRLERAGFRVVKIYGSVPVSQRKAAIENFNSDPEITVFLISLKAGGLALNLTEASHVFIADLWWNPAVEDQAMDRIHRIGQNRPIKITKIIIEDSIESRVLQLQKKKKALFDSAIDGDTSALGRLTEDDLVFLFN